MKERYCKFCGLELENGSCNCHKFFEYKKNRIKSSGSRICDTCGKRVESISNFCPYCGVTLKANGNIESLQQELRGEKAIDVIALYNKGSGKNGVKKKKIKSTFSVLVSGALVIFIIGFAFGVFLYPMTRQMIDDFRMKRLLENTVEQTETKETEEMKETEPVVETTQPLIDITNKDKWVRRDGYIYAFDKEGLPVVEDWVTMKDDNGNEQNYYFDFDGKLVVNSWIDGEYYVGSDGAMLKNQATPDGAVVGPDGKVLIQVETVTPVEKETYVYYESPNSSETKAASNQTSKVTGELKGIDPEKTYELYIKSIYQERDTIKRGDLTCNIIYYVPVLAGSKAKEVSTANTLFKNAFNAEFKESVKYLLNQYSELPKSMVFSIVEQRSVNNNRMLILTQGRLTPRKGLYEKIKYRFVYDRKAKTIAVTNITE